MEVETPVSSLSFHLYKILLRVGSPTQVDGETGITDLGMQLS